MRWQEPETANSEAIITGLPLESTPTTSSRRRYRVGFTTSSEPAETSAGANIRVPHVVLNISSPKEPRDNKGRADAVNLDSTEEKLKGMLQTKKTEDLRKESNIRVLSRSKPLDYQEANLRSLGLRQRKKRKRRGRNASLKKCKQLEAKDEYEPPNSKTRILECPVRRSQRKSTVDTRAPLKEESPETAIVNNDYCSACGRAGRLLCCESCPRSFHFTCIDPPIDEDSLPDHWYCRKCEIQKNPPPLYPKSLFSDLFDQLARRNPCQFKLPEGMRTMFECVTYGPHDEYVAENELAAPRGQENLESVRLEDKNGRPVLCFKCGGSALHGPMATCSYCQLIWHVDCLDPPVQSISARWMCPNHAAKAADLPRRLRKPHVVDVALRRGNQNNGNIDVVDDEDDDIYKVREVPFFGLRNTPEGVAAAVSQKAYERSFRKEGVVYRVPARSIKLDFLDKIHQRNEAPCHDTLVSSFLSALEALAHAPTEEREAVYALYRMKYQGRPDAAAFVARQELTDLVKAAADDTNPDQVEAIKKLIKRKGFKKLSEFLMS